MHDLESNREQTESLLDVADTVNDRFSRREFIQCVTATGATLVLCLNRSLLADNGVWGLSPTESLANQTIIPDYFGKNIGRTIPNIVIPQAFVYGSENDQIGTITETYQFESITITPTRQSTPVLGNMAYLPYISQSSGINEDSESHLSNPFLGTANWIRYFDQNTRNHIDLTLNDQEYRFILVNNLMGGFATIWAVGVMPPNYDMLTAIQLTDFKLTRQQLDLSALDVNRGILYCVSHATYAELKITKQYVEDELSNWIIAIDAKQLIRDVLAGTFSWEEGHENNPSQAQQYFIDIHELPKRCNIPFARTDGETHEVGWGIVYDHSRNRLIYASTDVNKRELGTPTGSQLNTVDLIEPPQFHQSGKDRRDETVILDEQSLPIHDPLDAEADFSADVAIAHLMINPWDENIMAVHNYSGVRGGSIAADNYQDDAPAEIVYFDCSKNANAPGVFHLNLPGPNANSSEQGDADRFMGHHSFISKHAMVANHSFRPAPNEIGQTIIFEYPHGRPFLDSLPVDYSGQVAIATSYEHTEWWWSRRNDTEQYLRFSPAHMTMSPDRRFMVQDTYYSNGAWNAYDELLLWFRTPQGYSCYTIVRNNLPRDENGNILPIKIVHPHPVFVDNRTFLYNHTVAASCKEIPCGKSHGQPEVCWTCPEAEVRMMTIPDAILDLDLLVLGSESDAGAWAYVPK